MKKNIIVLLGTAALLSLFLIDCGGREKIEVSTTKQDIREDVSSIDTIKVYVENSGSMNGYMSDGSELKDAVYSYISDINMLSKETQLNYINSRIIHYDKPLKNFISDLTPSAFRQYGGNISNTDLGEMLEMILKNSTKSNVSIFVSDCILDLPKVDAMNFLTNVQIGIKNSIVDKLKKDPDFAVEIVKLGSNFNGKYFSTKGTNFLKNVKRPYYMWILGNRQALALLNKNAPLTEIKHGIEDCVSYSRHSEIPMDILNRQNSGKVISPEKGQYNMTIFANFNNTLKTNSDITNLENYETNNSDLKVANIGKINKDKQYTHFISISLTQKEPMPSSLRIDFKTPNLPMWVIKSNDESGDSIQSNLDKTTGIKYLIQGVADAFKKEESATSLKFNIKHK